MPSPSVLASPSPAVSTLLTLLPPPVLKCRQFTVAGKHLTVLKGEQIRGSGLGQQQGHCLGGSYSVQAGGDRSILGGLKWGLMGPNTLS